MLSTVRDDGDHDHRLLAARHRQERSAGRLAAGFRLARLGGICTARLRRFRAARLAIGAGGLAIGAGRLACCGPGPRCAWFGRAWRLAGCWLAGCWLAGCWLAGDLLASGLLVGGWLAGASC